MTDTPAIAARVHYDRHECGLSCSSGKRQKILPRRMGIKP